MRHSENRKSWFITSGLIVCLLLTSFIYDVQANSEPVIFSRNTDKMLYDHFAFLPYATKPEETPEPIDPLPGENEQCYPSGDVEICASVSNQSPTQYSYVTVYGRLVIDGVPQTDLPMSTTWHYKTTTPVCDDGVTASDGIARCKRYISGATVGYQVNINVYIGGYGVTTSFTPIE